MCLNLCGSPCNDLWVSCRFRRHNRIRCNAMLCLWGFNTSFPMLFHFSCHLVSGQNSWRNYWSVWTKGYLEHFRVWETKMHAGGPWVKGCEALIKWALREHQRSLSFPYFHATPASFVLAFHDWLVFLHSLCFLLGKLLISIPSTFIPLFLASFLMSSSATEDGSPIWGSPLWLGKLGA